MITVNSKIYLVKRNYRTIQFTNAIFHLKTLLTGSSYITEPFSCSSQ